MRPDDLILPELLDPAPDVWDVEADVVVVGFGMAGACAALEAARAGADVVIVERFSGFGGTSATAGGHFYLGGGTPVQQACGIADSAADMEAFLTAITPAPIPDKIHAYCRDSVAQFDWLEMQGIPFERSFHPGKTPMQMGTEGLIWSGNEEIYPYRDIARPAPRGHKVAHPGHEGGGGLAMQHLAAKVDAAGVRVVADTAVDALFRDASGICGVRLSNGGGAPATVGARSGVILAGGGFSRNAAMVGHYLPQVAAAGERVDWIGAPGDDGTAIRLGQSAGGRTLLMDQCFLSSPFYPPEQLLKGILVNRDGERFVAEDCYHSRTGAAIMRQPGGIAWLILDDTTFAYPEGARALNQHFVDGWNSIEEMEAALALPSGSLAHTMERYAADAARGIDSAFHKHPKRLQPLVRPPYAAFDMSFGRATFNAFTLGGLDTTVDGEVLDDRGAAIAGLYAAGACASGIAQTSENYASGTNLGQASYFGRRTGFAAARRHLGGGWTA